MPPECCAKSRTLSSNAPLGQLAIYGLVGSVGASRSPGGVHRILSGATPAGGLRSDGDLIPVLKGPRSLSASLNLSDLLWIVFAGLAREIRNAPVNSGFALRLTEWHSERQRHGSLQHAHSPPAPSTGITARGAVATFTPMKCATVAYTQGTRQSAASISRGCRQHFSRGGRPSPSRI